MAEWLIIASENTVAGKTLAKLDFYSTLYYIDTNI